MPTAHDRRRGAGGAAPRHGTLADHPFDRPDGGDRLPHVSFCDRASDPAAVDALDPGRAPDDRWTLVGREIHVCDARLVEMTV